jgi:hypothetical protein
MSEKYPLWRRLREEIFSQLIRDQWGPYAIHQHPSVDNNTTTRVIVIVGIVQGVGVNTKHQLYTLGKSKLLGFARTPDLMAPAWTYGMESTPTQWL